MSLANYGIEMSSCPNTGRKGDERNNDRPASRLGPSAQIVRRVTIVALLSVAIITLLLAVPGLRGRRCSRQSGVRAGLDRGGPAAVALAVWVNSYALRSPPTRRPQSPMGG